MKGWNYTVRLYREEGLDVGEDSGTPVNLTMTCLFKFTGKLDRVTIVLK